MAIDNITSKPPFSLAGLQHQSLVVYGTAPGLDEISVKLGVRMSCRSEPGAQA